MVQQDQKSHSGIFLQVHNNEDRKSNEFAELSSTFNPHPDIFLQVYKDGTMNLVYKGTGNLYHVSAVVKQGSKYNYHWKDMKFNFPKRNIVIDLSQYKHLIPPDGVPQPTKIIKTWAEYEQHFGVPPVYYDKNKKRVVMMSDITLESGTYLDMSDPEVMLEMEQKFFELVFSKALMHNGKNDLETFCMMKDMKLCELTRGDLFNFNSLIFQQFAAEWWVSSNETTTEGDGFCAELKQRHNTDKTSDALLFEYYKSDRKRFIPRTCVLTPRDVDNISKCFSSSETQMLMLFVLLRKRRDSIKKHYKGGICGNCNNTNKIYKERNCAFCFLKHQLLTKSQSTNE